MVMEGGCVRRYDVCTCRCHTPGRNVKHTMACCYPCPHCHRNIMKAWHEHHVENCDARYEEDK